jgi:replicative DNA helicase
VPPRDLDVPVVASSQLKPQPQMPADKRPMLADRRESDALEQDSDIVSFIYRGDTCSTDRLDKGAAETIIAKHCNRPAGLP